MPAAVSYPKVSSKAWTMLRSKAATAPSTRFTPTSVAAMLDMANPKSAADNIVYPMRKLGLFDEEGALTERGNKWRNSATYSEACQEILDDVYPSELAGFTDDQGEPDASQVMKWMQHRGLGDSNARQMAGTYVMIAMKKIPDAVAPQTKKGPQNSPAKKKSSTQSPKQEAVVAQEPAYVAPLKDSQSISEGPNIHLDIQIHIPVEATADQIDQIFSSMAKHLYRK